jgi:hypothetical protein
MFSINRKSLVPVLIFTLSTYSITAQTQLGAAYGGNYDFGKQMPENYKSIGIAKISLIYKNESRLSPFLSVGFTKIPLNYSEVLVRNQGYFRTVAINNSTTSNWESSR